ncbi:MAG: hypothetical protein P9M01_04035 [Candidatus Kappaea frigidicola]|nr:hypothetical protein [Candidatus Kappaea frigidicola]
MINDIVGIFWMLIGLIGIVKPVFIHNFFRKKTGKRQFKLIIVVILLLGSVFFELFFISESILLRVLVVIGFVAVVRGILMLNKKAGEKISNYLSHVPFFYFRLIAIVFFVIGFIFLKIL